MTTFEYKRLLLNKWFIEHELYVQYSPGCAINLFTLLAAVGLFAVEYYIASITLFLLLLALMVVSTWASTARNNH